MEVIWSDGLQRCSVKMLAERLNMTRSSFYNAFGSLDALFVEILREYSKQTPDAPLYQAVDMPVLTLINMVFRDICSRLCADKDKRGCLIINSVCDLCPQSDEVGVLLADRILGSIRRLAVLLDIARERGELTENTDTHAMALSLQGLIVSLSVMCKVVHAESDLWLMARTTLEGLGLYQALEEAE